MTRWALGAGAVLVVIGLGWYGWTVLRRPVPTVDPAHEQRAAEAEANVEAKDAAIRGLAGEITRLRAEADRQGRARQAAEQRATAFAERAAELGQQLARIAAERHALTRATTTDQVRAALVRRGIIAR